MPPTITFVRHAQGYHNISVANHQLHDPLLTPFGKQQCEHLAKTFPYHNEVDLVVASPLKRTIYTALYSFEPVITKKDLTIIGVPEFQETSDLPCDTGSSQEELLREFAGYKLDLTRVEPDWNTKKGRWEAEGSAVRERCRVGRRWLRDRKESHIVVVAHGAVLHYLTEDWSDAQRFEGTGWANTEFRTYTFDPKSTDRASLIETADSLTRRNPNEKSTALAPTGEAQASKDKAQSSPNHPVASASSSADAGKIPSKV